jgi:hypothetical protein
MRAIVLEHAGPPEVLEIRHVTVHVTAEDIAHNVSHQEMPLEVLP